jgi:capsular exopolysaccharide synthesis family protein
LDATLLGAGEASFLDWRSWLPFTRDVPTAQAQQPTTRERAVASYAANLTVEPVPNTQLVRVHFESPDPELAARIANEHARAYIESLLDARVAVTESAANWMAERAEQMRKELFAAEARLQEFREREQLVDIDGLRALPSQEINDLSARLVEVRQTLAAAEISYRQVTQAGSSWQSLQSIPTILNDVGLRRFQEAEAAARQAVTELADRYGPKHPAMIAAQAELAAATASLEAQTRTVADAIRNQYEAARSEEAAIVAELDRASQRYQAVGRKESELNSLQRAVDTNRQLYELFYNRLSETTATGDLNAVQARVMEPAIVPSAPIRPNKGRAILIAVVLTAVLGVALAFLRNALDNTIRSSADVEEKLQKPLLATVPLLKGRMLELASSMRKDVNESELDLRFRESIRTTRTAISLDDLDDPHKIILVTSAVSGEGKSTIALNLARAFAHSEPTLLVDADMRRPSLGAMLNIPREAPGLSELLAGRAQLKQCVVRTGAQNLDAISTGFLPPDPLQLLSSARMRSALKVLSTAYKRIIIDTPPILPVSDAALLSKYADCVIHVVNSDSTTVAQIKGGLDLLARVKAPVTGIVLNQYDASKAEKYGELVYGAYYGTRDAQPRPKLAKATNG